MEQINHPDHYNVPGRKECIQEMRETHGDYITAVFCLTNIYKYLYRTGHKVNTDDVAKARWYWEYVNGELDCREPLYNDEEFASLYNDISNLMMLVYVE